MSYAPQYGIRRKWVKRAKNPFSLPCAVAPLNGRRAKGFCSTIRAAVGAPTKWVRVDGAWLEKPLGRARRLTKAVPKLQVLDYDIGSIPRASARGERRFGQGNRFKVAIHKEPMPKYGKAVSKAMAKNTVRYHAPYGVRPHMYLWHKTKWFGRFDENPWHPKPMHSPTGEFLGYANPDAPTMHKPYKVARALTGSGQ